jgi:hypothetical protein
MTGPHRWIRERLPWRRRKPAGERHRVRGRYTRAPEVSAFEPDGGAGRWWVTFTDPSSPEAKAIMAAGEAGGVAVEFSGEAGPPGEYGHMGQYERAFLVRAGESRILTGASNDGGGR